MTCAPASSSSFTASTLPSCAAHISAVCCFHVSFALTFAPRASSTRMASTTPVREAVINAVSPSRSATLASAPASSRSSIILALPLTAAEYIGVTP